MKFIRDLISEKANLAGRAAREQPTTDMVGTIAPDVVADPGQANDFPAGLAGPDVDIINKVASGGQALNNAAEYAFAAGEPTVSEPGIGVSAACKTPLTPASDYSETEDDNDGFDLTSDVAPLDLQDEGARDDPDELFGDLWTETSTDDAKPDPDLYDDGMAAPAAIAMPAVVSTPDVATFSEPGMAAEPVSAPRPKPAPPSASTPPAATWTRPATRAILSDAPPAPQAAAPVPAPAEPSPFQRIMQRDKHLPSDMPPHRAQPVSDMRDQAAREMPPKMPPKMPVKTPQTIKVPAPAAGRAAQQAGRVKTRLLGFNTAQDSAPDPFDSQQNPGPAAPAMYPVGWMVVTDGPGRGNAFTLFDGVSQIGRGEGQAIRLDFGDNSISRSSHAAIAYDGEQQAFFLGHGGKANLVRLNGNPVLSTEKLNSGALIRIGETTLRFVALCGNEFDWGSCQDDDIENAQFG